VKLFNLSNPNLSANGLTALFAAESSPHGFGIHELNLQTSELKLRFNAYYEAWSNSQNVVALLNASECGAALPRSSWICILNTDTGKQKVIYLTKQSFRFGGMDWSPDDQQLAVSYHEAASNSTSPDRRRIYLYNLQSDQFTPISPDSVDAQAPAWSPDGKYLAYIQTDLKSSEAQLMVMHADGSCAVPLIPVKGFIDSPAWSPDGNWLSFVYNFRLYKVDLNDEAIKRTLAQCS
jgi:Tol biopolymer transport system component